MQSLLCSLAAFMKVLECIWEDSGAECLSHFLLSCVRSTVSDFLDFQKQVIVLCVLICDDLLNWGRPATMSFSMICSCGLHVLLCLLTC